MGVPSAPEGPVDVSPPTGGDLKGADGAAARTGDNGWRRRAQPKSGVLRVRSSVEGRAAPAARELIAERWKARIREGIAAGRARGSPHWRKSASPSNPSKPKGRYTMAPRAMSREKQAALRVNAAFDAMADPTRRALFAHVARGPIGVTELTSLLPVTRPAVSQHLKVLREAGLVTRVAIGNRRIYRVDIAGLIPMLEWLDDVRKRGEASALARPPAPKESKMEDQS